MIKTKNVLPLLALLVLLGLGFTIPARAVTSADIKVTNCNTGGQYQFSTCKLSTYTDPTTKTYYEVQVICDLSNNCNSNITVFPVNKPSITWPAQTGTVDILTVIQNDQAGVPPPTPTPTNTATNAACQGGDAKACLAVGTESSKVWDALKVILNVMSGLVAVLAVIMLIVAGIQYSASNGDPSGVKAAKDKIVNVIIGLIAYVFLFSFLQWLIPGGLFNG
jgi:hypothetical protein